MTFKAARSIRVLDWSIMHYNPKIFPDMVTISL